MNIKVEFTKVFKKKDDMGNLIGFCDVTLDKVVTVRGCRYIKGEHGNFVATPSEAYEKDGKKQYKYIVKVEDEDFGKELNKAVEKEYKSEYES